MKSSRSPMTRRAAAALVLSTPIGIAAALAADDDRKKSPRPATPTPNDARGLMESWWADLEKPETEATRALLNMADRREETVAFLKAKMKPLKIAPAEVRALLLKLGNSNEKIWRPAFEELEYFDPRLAIDLETLMDRYKEAPGRQRMVEVMSGRDAGSLGNREVNLRKFAGGYNFFAPGEGSWWAENQVERINPPQGWLTHKKKWTRAVRAIVLLEHIRTPGAVAILKEMTTGHPDAQPTRVARTALERLRGTKPTGKPA